MKKVILGLIATTMFSINSFSQMNFIQPNNEILEAYSIEKVDLQNNSKLSCTKVNIGVNIFIAWASVDVYVLCGLAPTGTNLSGCITVSEKTCNSINSANRVSNYTLNIKDYFKDIDTSKVRELEITKSSESIEETDGAKLSIKLGKYPVDKDGNFELIVLKENK